MHHHISKDKIITKLRIKVRCHYNLCTFLCIKKRKKDAKLFVFNSFAFCIAYKLIYSYAINFLSFFANAIYFAIAFVLNIYPEFDNTYLQVIYWNSKSTFICYSNYILILKFSVFFQDNNISS